MKKPIFTSIERNYMIFLDLEIAKLKLLREFKKTKLYCFLDKTVLVLNSLLLKQ